MSFYPRVHNNTRMMCEQLPVPCKELPQPVKVFVASRIPANISPPARTPKLRSATRGHPGGASSGWRKREGPASGQCALAPSSTMRTGGPLGSGLAQRSGGRGNRGGGGARCHTFFSHIAPRRAMPRVLCLLQPTGVLGCVLLWPDTLALHALRALLRRLRGTGRSAFCALQAARWTTHRSCTLGSRT